MSTIKVDNLQTTGGVSQKTIQATIRFNQVSTQSIYAEVGVSSITDVATGRTTVTFDNAFANVNYCFLSGGSNGEGSSTNADAYNLAPKNNTATSSIELQSKLRGFGLYDYAFCSAAFISQ